MKILITGATGLVGSALIPVLLGQGHTVCRLVRPQTRASAVAGAFDVAWNSEKGELGEQAAGADAVVNLAGASIADGRWAQSRKQVLRTSRVNTTRALVAATSKMSPKPAVFVSASAIGFYGDRGDEVLAESSGPRSDFLSQLAQDWESEALRAEAFGTRVVLARFGIILAKHGGALPKMMLPFRLGLGGRTGNGRQWMSWIALDDAVKILQLALSDATLSGPINVVAPEPVTNATFTQELAKALHRPAIFPAPAFALRLALGEMADALLLSSQRVVPAVLSRSGYTFLHPQLAPALRAILGDRP